MRTAAAEDYPQDIAFHILLGLGMPRSAARKLADKPIPTIQLPPEALLVRTHQAPGAAH
jgi:hypothetical protein